MSVPPHREFLRRVEQAVSTSGVRRIQATTGKSAGVHQKVNLLFLSKLQLGHWGETC